MAAILPHQKQYVVGPTSVAVRPDWITQRLSETIVLSHCPRLRSVDLSTKDGVAFFLLGLAVQADPAESQSIAEAFGSRTSNEIEEWTASWAGRWLLISERVCYQDASGLLGLCYRRVGADLWISSSPAILGDLLPDAPAAPRLPWQVSHGRGMDWIPAPFTTRAGVLKVLPLRSLDPRDGSIRPVRYSPPAGTGTVHLAEMLKTAMANWARAGFREPFVGLTAGLDTRTVLAAAAGARISFRTYTTKFPFVAKSDINLPPRLAARVATYHLVHQTFRPAPGAGRRRAAMAEHMDGAMFAPSVEHFAKFEDPFLEDAGITFAKGNCFEIGRCYFWPKFANQIQTPTDADQILAAYRPRWNPEPLELWRRALQSWVDSLWEPTGLTMDWRDRFYLDQRLGAWLASHQMYPDVFDSTNFYPGNCLWMFDLLMRHAPAQRSSGAVQHDIIRLLAPRLLELPINPPPITRRIKSLLRVLLQRIRALSQGKPSGVTGARTH